MSPTASSEELAILKTCYRLMQNLEQNWPPQDENILFQISGLLRSLDSSEIPEIQKLSLIPDHFFPGMELKFFLNWLVPVERALGRQISDDQFLITRTDSFLLSQEKTKSQIPLRFVLENIRSVFNVGSIFRLSDCLATEHIHLIGYTATPTENENLHKTALGSVAHQAWSHHSKAMPVIEELKSQGYFIVGLETGKFAKNIYQTEFPNQKTAMLVGNERFGIENHLLDLCDLVVQIPTFGVKNSLNVANALSVAAYEWQRQCPNLRKL